MEAMGGTSQGLMTASFISMQPPSTVVAFAREVGGGFVTAFSQQFFLDRCFNNEVHLRHPASQSYVKRVVKALILAAESDGEEVTEDLYGLHAVFLDSDKGLVRYMATRLEHLENLKTWSYVLRCRFLMTEAEACQLSLAERCYTTLTFIIPESARPNLRETVGEERASDLIGTKLLTLRISLNMLDGATGYIVWPAGLYLAQVLLSHPQLVHGRSCLEAVLTDGALSTLANLRHNLETNGIPISENNTRPDQETHHGETKVDCRQLLWETTFEEELLSYRAQVIFGADLVYDPTIVPHLVRALAIMLQKRSLSRQGSSDVRDSDEGMALKTEDGEVLAPVAYIASALRNLSTLHLFLKLADDAGLEVTDVTETFMPLRILPAIYDLDSSQIRLHKVVSP